MADTPQTYQYRVEKQPNSVEETEQLYGMASRNVELGSSINTSANIMCGDLMRCLCCCFYYSVTNNNNSDCNCCSDGCCDCCDCNDCNCGECNGCDCGGCDNCDCGGCNC